MNGFQTEVEWFVNKNHVSEIGFNFFNDKGDLIGYTDIDATGNMNWQIVNLEYKDYLNNILKYLYVGDTENRISFESTSPNCLRWIRARIFIAKNKLRIEYNPDFSFPVEEERERVTRM